MERSKSDATLHFAFIRNAALKSAVFTCAMPHSVLRDSRLNIDLILAAIFSNGNARASATISLHSACLIPETDNSRYVVRRHRGTQIAERNVPLPTCYAFHSELTWKPEGLSDAKSATAIFEEMVPQHSANDASTEVSSRMA